MSDSEGSSSDGGLERRPKGEYVEDEDSEEDEKKFKKIKKRRANARDFIIEEAEVDTDDEEDEDAWREDGDDGLDPNEVEEAGRTAADVEAQMRRRKGRLDDFKMDEVDEKEIEEYYRNKYREDDNSRQRFGEGGEAMTKEITEQSLMPEGKDPKLWMVRCREGEEKTAVLQLMRKVLAYSNHQPTDPDTPPVQPLLINSVVSPEHVKGYIYVEAYKQAHVKAAIEGVSVLRVGTWSQQMVPIKEMVDVLKVVKDVVGLQKGQWVRLKRGPYKDDLGQVVYINEAGREVQLKLVPRIDYSRARGALRPAGAEPAKRKKPGQRPRPMLFDKDKVRAIGGEITNDGDFMVFESNKYCRQGFLIKFFANSAVLVEGVRPTLSELEKFEGECTEGLELELPAGQQEAATAFTAGDMVEVVEGELANLQGKVLAIEGTKVTILPRHEELKDPLEFQSSELRKYFRQGDHVKLTAGRHEGDTGLIVRVEEQGVVLLSDVTMHEILAMPKDLQLCEETAAGVDSHGQFQFADLVTLDAQTTGVIVQIQREHFQVLTMHDKVVTLRPAALQRRKDNRRATALDSEQSPIQTRDVVKVVEGPHSGRQGEIKHLFRNFAFLHSRMMTDNGGMFAVKCRHLLGVKTFGGAAPRALPAVPRGGLAGMMSPRLSPAHGGSSPAPGAAGGSGRGRGVGRDRDFVGQTVKITQGPYKGHIGMVKDATESTARVELHAKCQTITVDRTRLQEIGAGGRPGGAVSTYTRTPLHGGATPMYGTPGSRTPMYGSQTPMVDGSRTPHYGSMTPSHGEGEGGRTPGRSSGAWDPTVSNTPAHRPALDQYEPLSEMDEVDDIPSPVYADRAMTPSASPYQPPSYSPYQPYTEASPSSYVPASSPLASPSPGYQPSPSPSYMAPSPSPCYSPISPAHGPAAQGSAASAEELLGAAEWYSPNIEVLIRDTHEDTGLCGQIGVVRGVTPGMCSVFLYEEERTVNVVAEHLAPVVPSRGDRVKVILGDEDLLGEGGLLSIDSMEGVVKLAATGDVKMFQLSFLCKMRADE